MGDFGAIVRLGLRDVLDSEGDRVATRETPNDQIVSGLLARPPDVVVLDLDSDDGPALASRIANEFPAVKVVACSALTPTMRVYPPFHNGESYAADLNPEILLDAVLS
jgi:DNA-binding NarL/FixJ family response regulator